MLKFSKKLHKLQLDFWWFVHEKCSYLGQLFPIRKENEFLPVIIKNINPFSCDKWTFNWASLHLIRKSTAIYQKKNKVDVKLSHFSNHFYFSFLTNQKKVTSEKFIFEMYMKKKMLITSRETQYYYKYSDKEIIHTQWWYKNALNTRSEHLDRNIRVYLYRNIVIIKIKLIKSHLTTRIRTFFVTFLGYSFEREQKSFCCYYYRISININAGI